MKFRQPAFALIDLVLGMSVSAVLLAALASAMVIAAHAIPNKSDPLSAALDAALAAEQIAGELLVAGQINTRTGTAIEFTVADRNDDGAPEVVRFEWSGVAGQPLTRRYNNGTPVALIHDVYAFELSYNQVDASGGGGAESETPLFTYDAQSNLAGWPVTESNWIGQYFAPALPAEATSWTITRVETVARASGATEGVLRLQLFAADTWGKPAGMPLDEVTLMEGQLPPSYLWLGVQLSGSASFEAGAGACLVFRWVSNAPAAELRHQESDSSAVGGNLIVTSDGGSSWTAPAGKAMPLKVYGTVAGAASPSKVYRVTGVSIQLQAGSNESSKAETTVQLLNEPEVAGG